MGWFLWIVLVSAGWTHKPSFGPYSSGEEAFVVEDMDISIVLYQKMTCDDDQLWLQYDGLAGDELFVQLGVPVIDRLESYRPLLGVFGPGIEDTADVEFGIPGDHGGQVFEPLDEPLPFYEPFTQTESWIYVEETLILEQDGTGWIVAWHPERKTGKLWVAVGTVEDFSDVGIDDFTSWSAYLNDFHEKTGAGNMAVETTCEDPDSGDQEADVSDCSCRSGGSTAPTWLVTLLVWLPLRRFRLERGSRTY